MCLKALEIQELTQTFQNKILMKEISQEHFVRASVSDSDAFQIFTEEDFDKLMPIQMNEYAPFLHQVYDGKQSAFNYFTSFEQYRLAYLMKVKFSKIWINHEWINLP